MPNPKDDHAIIRRAPLFSALDDASAASVRESMTALKLAKGHTLLKKAMKAIVYMSLSLAR